MAASILDEFYLLTRRDIRLFFQESLDFFRSDYNLINDYFSGRVTKISSKPFERLQNLIQLRDSYFETIHLHTNRMSGTKWLEIIDLLETIDSRLQTLNNINRWARSSMTRTAYNPTAQINHTLDQNETLEGVAQTILVDSDPQNSWVQIALENELTEEDYSSQGGNNLFLYLNRTVSQGIRVDSVVDIIYGKTIYGKDLDRRLTIDLEQEDLVALGYDDTIMQSVDILINLKKNDNPAFSNLGLQTSVAIGGSRSALNFPIIVRQLTEAFSTDDTLKNFKVNQIKIDQDNLSCDFDVMTRLDEVLPTNDVLL